MADADGVSRGLPRESRAGEPAPGPRRGPALTTNDEFAAELRGFGLIGIVAIVVIVLAGNLPIGGMVAFPLGGVLALLWAWRSRTPWEAIGYGRPRSWIATVLGGIALGIVLKLVLKAIVMPLLGADPVNHAYAFLVGKRAILPAATWAMFVAGFGEETVWRGFLFERLGRVFGSGAIARGTIVVLTSGLFGAAHLADQGLPGAQQAVIVGLVYGTIVMVTGRIWLVMIAHTAFDLAALAIIHLGLESRVAHLLFP